MGTLPRSGTTLVQRLLNSSGDAVIFGDPIGHEVEGYLGSVLTRWPSVVQGYQQGGRLSSASHFTAGFAPDPGVQLQAWKSGLSALLTGFFAASEHQNLPVKGWKLAGPIPALLPHLRQWLPSARWILLRRSLEDCLRSAKAVGMADGVESISYWRNLDAENRIQFESLEQSGASILNLEYETMIANPDEMMLKLQAFAGCSAIDASVWNCRVNTTLEDGYVVPEELSDEERKMLNLSRCA
jgi:hypothetical protein